MAAMDAPVPYFHYPHPYLALHRDIQAQQTSS